MYSICLINKETLETNGSEKSVRAKGTEEANVTKGDCGGKKDKALVRKKGLSTHICLMHLKYLKYVQQYLFFLICTESRRGLVLKCFVEDSAKAAALLNHTNLLGGPSSLARYA